MKVCSCCKLEKPDALFYKHASIGKEGVRKKCNDCRNIYRKQAHKENPMKVRKQANDWASKNRGKINAEARKKRAEDPKRFKGYTLKKMFGITIEQYDAMLEEQNGVCAICECPETAKLRGKLKELSVDHDHTTLKVRGLLCWHCNTAIGKLKENAKLLRKAAEYIEEA
jgi:hypothetical protein